MTLDVEGIPGLFKEVERRGGSSRQLMATWAASVSREAQRNARAKGGQFWGDLAGHVQVREVSDTHAVVAVGKPGSEIAKIGYHKEHGGPISAPPGKSLAIPLPGSVAVGKRASEFLQRLFVVKGKKNAVLGRTGADGKFEALFTLVHKTKPQRAFPWWPTAADTLRLGEKEAAWWLKRAMSSPA